MQLLICLGGPGALEEAFDSRRRSAPGSTSRSIINSTQHLSNSNTTFVISTGLAGVALAFFEGELGFFNCCFSSGEQLGYLGS